ncbi:MAG: GMC family oxidoreductase, partial [Bryobacteraceae bacterium]
MKHVNAVVVGAGAGGGVAAKELAEAGLSVLLLERGQWLTPFDCRKDDLRNQRSPYLGNNSGPDDQRHPRVVVDLQGRERTVRPSQGGYQNNAACIGGGTLTYGAMAWRFMEQDFRLKSTYGPLAGSTMEDWPISYMDLEPYYEKAEWEMGVSGDDSANPFKALRRKPLPMPPVRRNRQYEILHPAAVRLGLHPFDIPMLRNSVPYGGRGPCMQCRWCCGFACEVDAKAGTHNTVIPKALATGNCRVETGCMVREILIDQRGRATGVVYFDGRDQRRVQSADVVVVAGGAIETARLLLNSRSRLFPQGLGNRYDWVGRNLQGHSYSGAAGLFDCEVYDDLGPGASVAICDFNHGNPGLIGGAMLAHEFVMLPVWLFDYLPPDIPSWGRAHKEAMQRYHHRTIVVTGPVQEMPVFDARVQLDPKVEDYWGIPVARLSGGRHPHIQDVSRFI